MVHPLALACTHPLAPVERHRPKSWFVGDNIPGKAHAVLLYANTAPAYRAKLAETAAKGYEVSSCGDAAATKNLVTLAPKYLAAVTSGLFGSSQKFRHCVRLSNARPRRTGDTSLPNARARGR